MMAARDLTAVLLFNYGGPDGLHEVRSFLHRIFSDPDILALPAPAAPLRAPLAWLIAAARARASRACYRAIGGASPLNAGTARQARALEAALEGARGVDGDFIVLPAMRYWGFTTDLAVRAAIEAGASRFVLLPLYPHFCRATTGSSLADFRRKALREGAGDLPVHAVDSYADHPAFVAAVSSIVAEALASMTAGERRRATLLFSAHGLPLRIAAGDPYVSQIEATVRAVVARLGFEGEVRVAYQSRLGPVRWLGPATKDVVRTLARRREGPLLVYPVSFVSEHQETLYELDLLYGEPARAAGLDYRRLPAPGCRQDFIHCLRRLTIEALGREPVRSADLGRAAPGPRAAA
jgi:ferrochelatase